MLYDDQQDEPKEEVKEVTKEVNSHVDPNPMTIFIKNVKLGWIPARPLLVEDPELQSQSKSQSAQAVSTLSTSTSQQSTVSVICQDGEMRSIDLKNYAPTYNLPLRHVQQDKAVGTATYTTSCNTSTLNMS